MYWLFWILAGWLAAGPGDGPQDDPRGLKDYFQDYFLIGASIAPFETEGPVADLILHEFNTITAENAMKFGPIHPEENRFEWQGADRIAAFARLNNLKLRGHTLCWHNQTPSWLFINDEGRSVNKEVLLSRLKHHITEVVHRYQNEVYAWDVVNEAISDNPDEYLRITPWLTVCGEEYLAKAFQYAHEADPEALLFYNDYNTWHPEKRVKIIRMIRSLQAQGIPIDGIGIQGHWSIYGPDEAQLETAISEYEALGLLIHITELDVSVYPPESKRRDKLPDEPDAFTAQKQKMQQEQYDRIFRVLARHRNSIQSVTFWNVSDQRTWLDHFPVRGRKNYPLLFDTSLRRKPVYTKIIAGLIQEN